jgi:hypothetical protein
MKVRSFPDRTLDRHTRFERRLLLVRLHADAMARTALPDPPAPKAHIVVPVSDGSGDGRYAYKVGSRS